MTYQNRLNINTSLRAPLGEFGRKMSEYGECYIGESFWLKNGLTLEDKAKFEAYQQLCDDPCFEEMDEMNLYEEATPPAIRNKIIDTICEITEWYQIEKNNPVIGSKIIRPECLGILLEQTEQKYIAGDDLDDISDGDLTSPYMKEREERYNQWCSENK